MREDFMNLIGGPHTNPVELHDMLLKMNIVDIADVFEDLTKEKTIQVFRLLPKSIAADVFSYIVTEKQQVIVEALTDAEVGNIIGDLFADDAVDFIEEMPANVVTRILRNVDTETRNVINQLLQYPEDSAGTIMTTEYVCIREDCTVREAFDIIRMNGTDKETIYTCYVIRRDRMLLGTISVRTLLLATPQQRISDIMDPYFVSAHTTDDQENIAELFRKYDLLSLPITDTENRLVGIVTVDDIVSVIQEENTEDFEIMAGISPSEEPYLKTGVLKLVKNRILWLLFLMLSATVTSVIIAGFENTLSKMAILMAFIPMLMNTGGNAGSQSSTMIIRGIALGDIKTRDILKILWIELRVGILCGIGLGIVNFVRVYFMNGRNVLLSLAVTVTLLLTVIIAKCIGCTLPIIAKKFKIDPALMASPLISTILDATVLVVYLCIAQSLLPELR
ncbi:MAG: magnesium transporter [Oscillospiraceae bacterium]|jgi:magnesium transporter|nr:magnesium transporter [Oscillospiraceae bacterium]